MAGFFPVRNTISAMKKLAAARPQISLRIVIFMRRFGRALWLVNVVLSSFAVNKFKDQCSGFAAGQPMHPNTEFRAIFPKRKSNRVRGWTNLTASSVSAIKVLNCSGRNYEARSGG